MLSNYKSTIIISLKTVPLRKQLTHMSTSITLVYIQLELYKTKPVWYIYTLSVIVGSFKHYMCSSAGKVSSDL